LIKVFFTDITSCVLNTGWTTQFFSVSRSVRQGSPISPYLFLINIPYCGPIFHYRLIKFVYRLHIETVLSLFFYNKTLLYLLIVLWLFLEFLRLSFFNFGESFQQWIKVFFTDITSCVLNTGWTTQFFSVSRGVRQGCPDIFFKISN
jgi:hypothetical protein